MKLRLIVFFLLGYFSAFSIGNISLKDGWKVFSSESKINPQNLTIPKKTYTTQVPKTVMAALVESKVFENPYYGMNMNQIDAKQFEKSWWYVKEFEIQKTNDEYVDLNLEGINYKANVWLNGQLVADTNQILGVFKIFKLPVTKYLIAKNTLSIEVFPPKAGDFTMGFVDWAPVPADKNMGIWREVSLSVHKAVELSNTFVYSKVDLEKYAYADLFVSTEVTNHSNQPIQTTIDFELMNGIKITIPCGLKALEKRKVKISSEKYKELHVLNPQLWWPAQYVEPVLHQLKAKVTIEKLLSDEESITFGIREVSDYFTSEGARAYKINGKPILIKGGGWVDKLFLENSNEYDEAQVKYVRDMGLNCIRFEGFWGTSKNIYNLCDKYGILAMVGFSCQWEWHDYIGGKTFDEGEEGHGAVQTEEEMRLVSSYFRDMTIWLRNNPSVFAWLGGSDRLLKPELEEMILQTMRDENPTGLYCGAAKMKKSKVTGSTGVKMEGPYDYVPPMYWYTDTLRGGAFGFNTETGPGPQPTVLESTKKYIPERYYWPIDTVMWNFHSGRHAFANMDRYIKPLNIRYGKMNSLEEFSSWSQVQSYELMRPMFESFVLNQPKTTGIVQWMLNSAWPETFWQLYDFYLYPTGAYYGCKKANQAIVPIYNYGSKTISVVNQQLKDFDSLKVEVKVFNTESREVLSKTYNINLKALQKNELLNLPEYKDENKLTFISLKVLNSKNELLADNFYWVSNKEDKMDPNYFNSSWIFTPSIEFADLTYLRKLPKTSVSKSVKEISSTNENEKKYQITLENQSNQIAFFIENKIMNAKDKTWIVPAIWSDNYVSLLPNEKRSFEVTVAKSLLQGAEPEITFSFLNMK